MSFLRRQESTKNIAIDIMKQIKADELLTKIEFNEQDDWGIYPKTIYTCSICDETIIFKFTDFKKHVNFNFNNLSESDAKIFNNKFKLNNENYNSYLDFYCQKCNIATRIYFLSGVVGKGTLRVILKFIAINKE